MGLRVLIASVISIASKPVHQQFDQHMLLNQVYTSHHSETNVLFLWGFLSPLSLLLHLTPQFKGNEENKLAGPNVKVLFSSDIPYYLAHKTLPRYKTPLGYKTQSRVPTRPHPDYLAIRPWSYVPDNTVPSKALTFHHRISHRSPFLDARRSSFHCRASHASIVECEPWSPPILKISLTPRHQTEVWNTYKWVALTDTPVRLSGKLLGFLIMI